MEVLIHRTNFILVIAFTVEMEVATHRTGLTPSLLSHSLTFSL